MEFDASKISVVICVYTFDRFHEALYAVASITSQSLPAYEIIVVVDHNISLYEELLHALPEDIILVSNQFEQGLSGARNTGVSVAKGDVITFLDDDAVADSECLKSLSQCFEKRDVLGAVALIEPLYEQSGKSWFPDEFLWVVGCSYRGLSEGVTRNLLGACMAIRRSVFEEVGHFKSALGRSRSKLPLGNEETELCIRAANAYPDSCFIFSSTARASHRVTASRLTWSYFVKRCYAEGISKAQLTSLVGSGQSLSSERSYVLKTLSSALVRNFKTAIVDRDVNGLLRIVAIMLGFVSTLAGYIYGQFKANKLTGFVAEVPRFSAGIMMTIRNQKTLFLGASLLAFGTAVSSALGFVYWLIAAKQFSPASVGYAAAGISLMNFIGHLGEVGFGALLIGETRNHGERINGLISAGLQIAFSCSAAVALIYLVLSTLFPVTLGDIGDTNLGRVTFVAGCALTGVTLVLDQAMVGLSRTALQVVRNVTFAFIKLFLLIAVPVIMSGLAPNESTILSTWIIGQIASLVLLAFYLRRDLRSVVASPDFAGVKPLLPHVIGHHGLNLANLAPSLLLPFIVTAVLSPSINAAFYAAWTLINVAFLAPASLSTIVFASGKEDPAELPERLKTSLASSILIAVLGAISCFVLGRFVLGVFSDLYADLAASSFTVLGFSLFPIAIKYHYVAVQRLFNRMGPASALVGFGCLLELGGAIIGGTQLGLFGLSLGWLIGLTVEALFMVPTLVRAADLGGDLSIVPKRIMMKFLHVQHKPEQTL